MAETPTVLWALRQFLPEFLNSSPALSADQRRALWAITHCRTPALGGRAFACTDCSQFHFAWHSCNHKACPQCGRAATARWVHCLVPGAGLNDRGRFVRVRKPGFLVHLPLLQAAFREHLRDLFHAHDWQVDPDVWGKNWGVHIQPAGNGAAALKYLGVYVARTAISDARMLRVGDDSVTFRWKNRDAANRPEISTLPGVEFVERYLRHFLPRGLRSIRSYGFCHPAARVKRIRIQCHAGGPVQLGASTPISATPAPLPLCPCCSRPMRLMRQIASPYRQRGPPTTQTPVPSSPNVS